ncbi:glycosyl transferase [Streptomyces sp. NPDC006288]|uniref:glycosyl transferase n=1 Tax=Streptomyces sp. NPDC006288 TaxID=3156743 RepID=UPI0033AB63D8
MPSEGNDHDERGRPDRRPVTAYRTRYRAPAPAGRGPTGTVLLAALAPVLTALLLLGAFLTRAAGDRSALAGTAALVALCLLAPVVLANAVLVVHAIRVASEPVPAAPEPGTPVAFLVTHLPGEESLPAVRAVLEGAVRLRHPGPLDVWLLDDGDEPEARMLCAELGVHHFTRRGVPEWNQEEGPHRAGAEHGNHNAWVAKHGDAYGLLASAAPGHVPGPDLLERTTGCFRDPDTAFAVGAQVHGDHGPEPRRASLRALAQRAGNRYGAPLLAGTVTVVRVDALRRAGGFRAPAARDTATGLEIHRRRNPLTGRYWRSVHTPGAPGAGGACGPPQDGSRGLYRTLLPLYGKALFRVPPGRLLGYTLLLLDRPVAYAGPALCALTWLLFPMSPWSVLALPAALLPAVTRSRTLLRERRIRTERPAREAGQGRTAAAARGN